MGKRGLQVANIVMKKSEKIAKFKKMISIIKFLNSIDDLDVIKSSLEAIIEMLEEEISK
jgi:hypothetical protein